MRNLYTILSVSESASAEEIKSAYKKRSKQTHPDLNNGDKSKEAEFKEVQQAYESLSNAATRAQHDAELRAAREAAVRAAAQARAVEEERARTERQAAEARARAQASRPAPPPARTESPSNAGVAIAVGAGASLILLGLAALLGGGGGGRGGGDPPLPPRYKSPGSRSGARWDPSSQRFRGSDGRFRQS